MNVPENTKEYPVGTELFFKKGAILDFNSNDIKITISHGTILSIEKYRGSPDDSKFYIRYKTSHIYSKYGLMENFNTFVYHTEVRLSELEVIQEIINDEIAELQELIKSEQNKINQLTQYLNTFNK